MARSFLLFLFWLLLAPIVAAENIIIPDQGEFSIPVMGFSEQIIFDNNKDIPDPDKIWSKEFENRFKANSSKLPTVFDSPAVWMRFKVQNSRSEPLLVNWYSVIPAYDIQLFLVSSGKLLSSDRFRQLQIKETRTYFPSGSVKLPTGTTTIYLAINTANLPTSLNFNLATPNTFEAVWLKKTFFLLIIFGALIGILLYAIGSAITTSTRFLVFATGAQIFTLIIDFIYIGWVSKFLPWLPVESYQAIILTSSALAFFFINLTIQEHLQLDLGCYALKKWLQSSYVILAAIPLTSSQIFLNLSLQITHTLAGLILFAYLFFKSKRYSSRKLLEIALAFGPVLVTTALFLGSFFGIPGDQESYHNARLVSILSAFIFNAIILGEGVRRTQHANSLLSNSLRSVLSTHGIQKIIQSGKAIQTTPSNKRVTIMFIDIVGYSLSSQKLTPQETFDALKTILNRLTNTIHKYNGVIDKSLGDGCLCFFGYDLVGGIIQGHEETALQCALEIQKTNTELIVKATDETKGFIFPLRIGINTAEVCIGNMGDSSRFDFTMTGDGVVMASRFESGCEPFKIILGTSTYQGLTKETRSIKGLYPRLVTIKHHRNLEESYELNPFEEASQLLSEAVKKYWRSLDVDRKQDRISVEMGNISVESKYGAMDLINFSPGGYCLRSPVFLGKGVKFELSLTPILNSPSVSNMSPVIVEVTWGVPDKNGEYQIGVKLISLNDTQRNLLAAALQKELTSRSCKVVSMF